VRQVVAGFRRLASIAQHYRTVFLSGATTVLYQQANLEYTYSCASIPIEQAGLNAKKMVWKGRGRL
jgi:hypothetical protein